MKRPAAFTLALVVSLLFCTAAIAAPINLNTWTQEGPLSNGNWTVSGDGSNVFQSINGNPTYFVSDTDYINTVFDGSFAVETSGDDDYIGFVFGWNGINDYYLFDWKQANQSPGLEGFTLAKISGPDVDFWDHTGDDIEVLDSDYGTTLGWVDFAVNTFSLDYTTSALSITVNDVLIFSETGTFQSGKFGFYNYSQERVRYQGFTEEVSPNAVPEPSTFILLGAGLLGLIGFGVKRRKA